MFCAGCSTTSNLPEGEVLYTGLKKINYLDRDSSDYSVQVEEEVEAAWESVKAARPDLRTERCIARQLILPHTVSA